MIEEYKDVMLLLSCEKGKLRYEIETPGFLVNIALVIKQAGFSETLVDIFNKAKKYYEADGKTAYLNNEIEGEPRTSLVKPEGYREIMFPNKIDEVKESNTSSESGDSYDLN